MAVSSCWERVGGSGGALAVAVWWVHVPASMCVFVGGVADCTASLMARLLVR